MLYTAYMDYSHEAQSALLKAEERLRQILGDAAKAGAYDAVGLLSDAARSVGVLRIHLAHLANDPMPLETASCGADGSVSNPISRHSEPEDSVQNGRLSGKVQFGRDERYLIKLAWSKAKGSNYEHRAPIEVARLVVRAILRHGGAKRLVPTEKFLPLVDPGDKSEIPSYQSYLSLAWLVQEGLVGKNGRRGYTVFDAEMVEKSLEERWAKLPSQKRNGLE